MCASREFIDAYVRDMTLMDESFKYDRSTLTIVDAIEREKFEQSAGLLMKSIGSTVDCDPICNGTKQKENLDKLNYVMLRYGSNNNTLSSKDTMLISDENVTIALARYNKKQHGQ